MGKSVIWFIVVIVVGALLGSFLGNFIGIVIPPGAVRDLFLTDLRVGLNPTSLDLRILEVTLGFMFKINFMAIVGIAASAFIFKSIVK
jgi:hypothetical protein